MSLAVSDTHGDTLAPSCPTCGAGIRSERSLSKCGHPGCETRGCHACLKPCSNSDSCGLFCDEHLVATGARECLCFTCIRIDFAADDLIEAEMVAA